MTVLEERFYQTLIISMRKQTEVQEKILEELSDISKPLAVLAGRDKDEDNV